MPAKIRRLPRAYWISLLGSFAALVLARIAISTIGYRRLSKMLPQRNEAAPDEMLDRLAWCIPRAAKFVFKASCLPQAVAMQIMLLSKGYGSEMRLGARRTDTGAFLAHAWLTSEGRVILGGSDAELAQYSMFKPMLPSDP